MATDTATTVISIAGDLETGANAGVALPSLLPNDVVDDIRLWVQGTVAENVVTPLVVGLEVYIHNSRPIQTDAAMRAGRKVLDITIPMDFNPADATDMALPTLKVTVPMFHRSGQRERFLAVVITTTAANPVSGSCAFKVFRPTLRPQ